MSTRPVGVIAAQFKVPVNVGVALNTIEPVPVTELESATPP